MCNTERERSVERGAIVTELKIYGDHDERTVPQIGGDLDEAPRYRP